MDQPGMMVGQGDMHRPRDGAGEDQQAEQEEEPRDRAYAASWFPVQPRSPRIGFTRSGLRRGGGVRFWEYHLSGVSDVPTSPRLC